MIDEKEFSFYFEESNYILKWLAARDKKEKKTFVTIKEKNNRTDSISIIL